MKWFRRKKNNRKVNAQETVPIRWPRVLLIILSVALVFAAGTAMSLYLRSLEWEQFQALEVSGELERVSAEEVYEVLKPFVAEGFAGINIRGAQQSLEELPWVADARVRRQWPGTLVVDLREEQPVATWYGMSLMNAEGKVFVDGVSEYSGVLPDIAGPVGTQREMILRLNEVRTAADGAGLNPQRLLRTERRAERLWLDNGVEVRLGRRDVDARLQRFLDVAWPALQARVEQIAYVDMRYTNGFAVGWKAVSESRREKG